LSFSDHFVKTLIRKIFPTLRKTQLVNLSLGVFGQIKSQSGLMSVIVREVPGAVKHKHRLKRFWRFLSNPLIKPNSLRLFWFSWCLNKFVTDRVIPVAIDWTTLPGNIQCLMIAIPFHGRAIPLLWYIVLHSQIKDSQNLIEERLLARLINLVRQVSPAKKLLVSADRGFGRATLFQFLQKKQILFVIRVKADVTITTKVGKRILLRNRGKTLKENKPVWYGAISYRGDRKVTGVNLACVVAPPKEKGAEPDPWFLVTNLRKKETTIKRYHDRFHIEEWFKDMKHQLGIDKLQTRNLMRVRRLLLVSAVAYGITMLIGTVAKRLTSVQDQLITGGKKVASRIWFALNIIKHNLLGSIFWKKVYLRATVP
jgi:hypothetical protein